MPVAAVELDGAARSAQRRDGSPRTLHRPRREGRRALPSGVSARLRPDPLRRDRAADSVLRFQHRRECHIMKIASFKAGQAATYGLVTDTGIIDAGKRLKAHPTLKSLLATGSLDQLKA